MRASIWTLLLVAGSMEVTAQTLRLPSRDTLARPFFFLPSAQLKVAPQRLSPAQDDAARHLPFFCEQERVWDKKLPLPVRLRLGSMQQTDWLESKSSAISPQP